MLKILLVEDDFDLAATIIDYLEYKSIICDHAYNGRAGLNLAREGSYNVLLLDINMPGMSGLTLCETLRNEGNDTPILMLTALDTLNDKLAGFDAGTDDYLVKPFDIEELLVRIQALAKRKSGQNRKLIVGEIQLDLNTKTALVDGKELHLTPITFQILTALMRAAPDPVPQRALYQAVWGEDPPDSNALRVHIHHLRKALAVSGATERIQTNPGFGFALKE
jgi:DNA-binding response OmpR family regulator